jgi:hypothetical protein
MLRRPQILLLVATTLVLCGETPQDATETFVWSHGTQVIGRLSVPAKFRVEVYDYREGLVTTLHYQNGAYIILQAGGMYRLPLFQEPEYKLSFSTEKSLKTARVGLLANTGLRWREDNVGYAKVSPDQQAEFDKAIDSFVREVNTVAPLSK